MADEDERPDFSHAFCIPTHTGHHNPYLHGNGEWCPSCCDGRPPNHARLGGKSGCNHCGGHLRVPYSAEAVVKKNVRKRHLR